MSLCAASSSWLHAVGMTVKSASRRARLSFGCFGLVGHSFMADIPPFHILSGAGLLLEVKGVVSKIKLVSL